LCRITGGPAPVAGVSPGRALRDALEAQGVMVRYFDREGLRDCIRISVGRPQDTDALVAALQRFASQTA
jgi:histidinol-phosphate aminotransferase